MCQSFTIGKSLVENHFMVRNIIFPLFLNKIWVFIKSKTAKKHCSWIGRVEEFYENFVVVLHLRSLWNILGPERPFHKLSRFVLKSWIRGVWKPIHGLQDGRCTTADAVCSLSSKYGLLRSFSSNFCETVRAQLVKKRKKKSQGHSMSLLSFVEAFHWTHSHSCPQG